MAVVASLVLGPRALAAAMMLMIGSMGVLVPSANLAMLASFPNVADTAASIGMLVTTSCGALAVWIYAETLGGTVAGFGVAIAALSALSAIGWLLLPATETVR